MIDLVGGRSVNCRYHERNRRQILESRVLSTRILGEVVSECKMPPPVWLNASAATIYRHTYGSGLGRIPPGKCGGTLEAKDEFSVEVATAWERALNPGARAHRPHERSPCARRWFWEPIRTVCFRRWAFSRALVLAAKWLMAVGLFHGFIRRIFARAVDWLINHNEISMGR